MGSSGVQSMTTSTVKRIGSIFIGGILYQQGLGIGDFAKSTTMGTTTASVIGGATSRGQLSGQNHGNEA